MDDRGFDDQDGAFDQAVVGVEAVEHTASPFHFKADDPQGGRTRLL